MLRWKVLVFAVILCGLYTCAAGQRNKVLYPAALRVKRGVVNPTFQNSVEDAELLFEGGGRSVLPFACRSRTAGESRRSAPRPRVFQILLAGVQMGGGRGGFSVRDEELASLRRTRVLASVCEDVLPRRLTDVRRLTSDLSRHRGRLRGPDFERTVLTMVYAAHKLANTTGHQRDRWAESFFSLYRAIKQDLTVQ